MLRVPGAVVGSGSPSDAVAGSGTAHDRADAAVLSAAERERAAAFRRAADRELYVAAHAGLRWFVAPFVGVAPEALEMGAAPCPQCGGPHGRPVLPQAPDLHVSLTHATGLAAVAVAASPVGIDVEPLARPAADLDPLVPQLHPDERRAIAAAGHPHGALLRLWVRKEAAMKARGLGLAEPLDAHSTAWPGPRGTTTDGLAVVDLDVGPDHVAAVAVHGPAAPVVRVV